MALNVYLTFFHRYSGEQLIALEPYYLAFNYGVPFIPAMAFIFAHTEERGHIFGDAEVSSPFPSTTSRSITIFVRMANPLLALVLGENRMEYSSRCYILRPGLVSFGRSFLFILFLAFLFLTLPTGSSIDTHLISLFISSFDISGGELNLAPCVLLFLKFPTSAAAFCSWTCAFPFSPFRSGYLQPL